MKNTGLREPSPARMAHIDALRGLAAVYVALFHLQFVPRPNLPVPGALEGFLGAGGSGVTLFFLLSAFTLALSMEQRRDEANSLLNYYVRRFFRIAPLFYLWLLVMCIRSQVLAGGYSWPMIALNLGFGFNFCPGKNEGIVWASWTLGVEMVFYLILPLVMLVASTWRRALAFFVVTVAVAAGWQRVLLAAGLGASVFHKYSFLRQLPVFVLGIVCFHVYRGVRGQAERYRNCGYALIAVAVVGHGALAATPAFGGTARLYTQAALYGALLLGLSVASLRVLVNPWTRFLGKWSYSLYLNHPMTIALFAPVFIAFAGRWGGLGYLVSAGLLLAVLIPVSYLTYRLIEQPGIHCGERVVAAVTRWGNHL